MIFKQLFKKLSREIATSDHSADPQFHLSRLNRHQLASLDQAYRDIDPYPGFSKYLNAAEYIPMALCHVELAGLMGHQPVSLLDIGTGAGYFPFVCSNLGHNVMAMDVPSHDFYIEMTTLLGVNRIEHRIEAFQPLPNLGKKFDFVTAFAICFNGHATDSLWGPDEWAYFLRDLRDNHTNPGATLFFKLNQEPGGQLFSDELRPFFESQGAAIDLDMVRLTV